TRTLRLPPSTSRPSSQQWLTRLPYMSESGPGAPRKPPLLPPPTTSLYMWSRSEKNSLYRTTWFPPVLNSDRHWGPAVWVGYAGSYHVLPSHLGWWIRQRWTTSRVSFASRE